MSSKIKLPTIIAITGRKRNGKDTLANLLIKKYNYVQLSYAEPIKQICKVLFGFTDEQCYGNEKEIIDKNWNIMPRSAFQFIGTELFRKQMKYLIPNIGEDFWVKCLHENIKRMVKNDPNVKIVITDVRFPNELEGLKLLSKQIHINMVSVRVTRASINKDLDQHESEILIDKLDVDFDVKNDQEIKDLYESFEKKVLEI